MSESQITSPIGQNLANYWGLMLGDIEDQADLVALIESINIAGGVVIEDDLLSVSIITSLSANQGRVLKEYIDAHLDDVANPHAVTATHVGLGSVDDTADADKLVSTAGQTALNLKADLALVSNVDNTADADKPISDATQAELDTKLHIDSSMTGLVGGNVADLDSITTTDLALGSVRSIIEPISKVVSHYLLIINPPPTSEPLYVRPVDYNDPANKKGWILTSLLTAFLSTRSLSIYNSSNDLAIIDSDTITTNRDFSLPNTSGTFALVSDLDGYSNLDNTADLDKPISNDTQTALDLKEDSRAFLADGTISANKTFTDGDYGKIFAVSGSYTLTLPPPDSSNYGQRIGLYVNNALASATFAGSIPSGQDISSSITNITKDAGLLMIESTFLGWFANSQYGLIDCTMSGNLSIPDPLTLDATSTTNLRAAVGIGLTSVKTTTYAATASDGVIVGRHATVAFTISLLAVAGNLGASVKIINGGLSGQATITVDVTGGGSNISEAGVAVASVDLLPGESVEFENDGTIWITT